MREEPLRVRDEKNILDVEADKPVHRLLIVFGFRSLQNYLRMIGCRRHDGVCIWT